MSTKPQTEGDIDKVEMIPEEKQVVESGPCDFFVTFDQLSLFWGGDIGSCLCVSEPPVPEILNNKGFGHPLSFLSQMEYRHL